MRERRRRDLLTPLLFALAVILVAAASVITWQAIKNGNTRAALLELEMEKRLQEIRKEQRNLTKSAIAVGEWEVARN